MSLEGSNPVEQLIFKRSSRCESNQCVEISIQDHVFVRDRSRQVLELTRPSYEAFLRAVKSGAFDV